MDWSSAVKASSPSYRGCWTLQLSQLLGSLTLATGTKSWTQELPIVWYVSIFAGMLQVAELDGCPRMGPTFGAMFMSGQKAAHCALNSLRRQRAEEGALPAAEKELVSA